jgi:hypothetical protein
MLQSVKLTEMLLFTDIKLIIRKLVSSPCLQRLVAEKLNFVPHTYYRDGTLNIAYRN